VDGWLSVAVHCPKQMTASRSTEPLARPCFRLFFRECHCFRPMPHPTIQPISMAADSPTRPEKRRRVDRVIAACDLCKRRKVKCDGVCGVTCSIGLTPSEPLGPATIRDRLTTTRRYSRWFECISLCFHGVEGYCDIPSFAGIRLNPSENLLVVLG
jgi:hypothetical protein